MNVEARVSPANKPQDIQERLSSIRSLLEDRIQLLAYPLPQVALFFSLMFTNVTVVAIISSVEMFFAAWLAGHVFKTENRPGSRFYFASILAGAGVIILAVAP